MPFTRGFQDKPLIVRSLVVRPVSPKTSIPCPLLQRQPGGWALSFADFTMSMAKPKSMVTIKRKQQSLQQENSHHQQQTTRNMTRNAFISCALAACGFVSQASAQNHVYITGSTAFRSRIFNAIKALPGWSPAI